MLANNWKFSTKIVIAFSTLVSLGMGSLALVQYWQMRTSQRQAMSDRLSEIVQLAAPQVDGDYHSLVTSNQDSSTTYYRINQKQLEEIQAASDDIQHLYTVRQQPDGQYAYILDYRSDESTSITEVGSMLINPPSLLASGRTIDGPTVEPNIVRNSANIPVLTGYAPILGQFDRIDGLLVVELDARPILRRELQAESIALATLIVILAIAVVTIRYLAQVLVVRPTHALNQAAKRLAEGEWTATLPTTRKDELGELAQSFNHMAEHLQQSFKQLEDYSQNLEEKVEVRTQALLESQQAAQQASEAKSEFLANMNHELRTPLNGILGYTQILQRDPETGSKHQKGLNTIHQCATHLLSLINDILDFSKLEVQKMELSEQDFHLGDFLSSTVDMCRIKAEQKGVELIYESSLDLPIAVRADDKRLRQVLINLIGNAAKFTDRGSVTFRVQTIQTSATENNCQRLRFEIQDTGIGIDKSKLDKIFSPFEQAGECDRNSEGTGLGLAISRRIVQMMGGDIQVESELGKGSTFWFEVDLLAAREWTTHTSRAETIQINHTTDCELSRSALKGHITPPAAELAFLYAAAKDGFMAEVQQEVARIKALDERYAPFADKLLALSHQFNDRALLELVQPLMKETLV